MRKIITMVALSLAVMDTESSGLAQGTFNYSTTLDLSSGTLQSLGGNADFQLHIPNSGTSYTLNPSDTLTGTIYFANNQSIIVNDPTSSNFELLSFGFGSSNPQSINYTESVTLLGVSGNFDHSNPYTAGGSGGLGLDVFELTDSSLTFTGFSYSVTLLPSSATGGPYSPNIFEIQAGPNDITLVGTVPEPSTLVLVSLGTAALLARRRKFKK